MGKAKDGDMNQPALFSVESLPDSPETVAAAKTWERTGKALSKDEERVTAIVEEVVIGVSFRKIAKRHNISRNSITTCVQILSERGKLEPLKQRMAQKLGTLAEMATDYTMDLIDAGVLPAQCAPIVIGVASDKKALLEGSPTEVIAVQSVQGEDVLAKLRRLKAQAQQALPDNQSGADIAQSIDNQGCGEQVMLIPVAKTAGKELSATTHDLGTATKAGGEGVGTDRGATGVEGMEGKT